MDFASLSCFKGWGMGALCAMRVLSVPSLFTLGTAPFTVPSQVRPILTAHIALSFREAHHKLIAIGLHSHIESGSAALWPVLSSIDAVIVGIALSPFPTHLPLQVDWKAYRLPLADSFEPR